MQTHTFPFHHLLYLNSRYTEQERQMNRFYKTVLAALVVLPAALLAVSVPTTAQSTNQNTDHDDIMATIATFFEGFSAGDSTLMYSVVDRTSRLVITANDEDGNPIMTPLRMEDFIPIIVRPREENILETYWGAEIRVEENLAAVWLEYNLWVGDRIDHCGNDHLQLFRSDGGWKIIAIADTQLREGCKAHSE